MQQIHGDLLIGGLTLPRVAGVMREDSMGQLEVNRLDHCQLELHRPYLFQNHDGHAFKLVLTGIERSRDHRHLIAQFASTS